MTGGLIVDPTVGAGRVWCACGSEMEAVEGRRLDEPMWWLWWRCTASPADHLTVALPMPAPDENITVTVAQGPEPGQLRLL